MATYGRGYPGFAPSYGYQFPGKWLKPWSFGNLGGRLYLGRGEEQTDAPKENIICIPVCATFPLVQCKGIVGAIQWTKVFL